MIHAIKIQPPYFDDVISGKKQFEIRLNDREYQEGDYLALNEWEQTSSVGGHYTGRSCLVYVDYILYGAGLGIGLDEDYCIMSIKPCVICKAEGSYWIDGIKYKANAVKTYENPVEAHEQEETAETPNAIRPRIKEYDVGDKDYFCICGQEIKGSFQYCCYCGKKIDWSGIK